MKLSYFLRAALTGSLVVLAGCVPSTGNYSEFSVHNRAGVPPSLVSGDSVRFAEGVYRGELGEGRPNGHGVFTFSNGIEHRGSFVAGKAEGPGERRYPDGRVVSGDYRDDVEQDVRIAYPDGRTFEGAVRQGVASGPGTMTFPSGQQLTGRFKSDTAEGNGLLTNANGVPEYAGPFKGGKPNGEGVCAGGASCIKENGRDVTGQRLQQQAEKGAMQELKQEFDEQLQQSRQDFQPQDRELSSELERAQAESRQWTGPQSGDDCYCEITGFCLMVEDSNATSEQRELNELAWQRRKAECRAQWADYLGNKGSGNYQAEIARINSEIAAAKARHADARAQQKQREAEIEAARQRVLADEAEKRRRVEAQLAKEEAARKAKLEQEKQRCSTEQGRRATPCRCDAVLQIRRPVTKGSVCEA